MTPDEIKFYTDENRILKMCALTQSCNAKGYETISAKDLKFNIYYD